MKNYCNESLQSAPVLRTLPMNTYLPTDQVRWPNALPDTTMQPPYSTPTILPFSSIEECQLPHPTPVIHSSVSPNPILCAEPGVYFPAGSKADLPGKTYSCPIPNPSMPYLQSITSSGGSDLVPTFTHFSGIRLQTLHLSRTSLFHLPLPLALPQYDSSRSVMVPKPFIEDDRTPIRNTQPLPHRLIKTTVGAHRQASLNILPKNARFLTLIPNTPTIVSNLPAISGDIARQTAETTLEHLLSAAGIGPNNQPAFFESHKIGYPTGLSDPPQSRYKALNTDYFEIVGPENDIRYTTKIHAFLNANPYREWSKVPPQFNPQVHLLTAHFLNQADPSTFASPLLDEDGNVWPRLFAHFTDTKENDVVRYVRLAFDAQRHSGKDGFEAIERVPEDLLRKAVKAHIDKHFGDMLDIPAESCISITTESSNRQDQCKVLVAVRLACSTMVDKITASKDRSTFSAKLNIPIRSMPCLAPQANNRMEPLLVEHTITGVFKRLVKTRGMQEPYAIVVLWAKSNSDPQSVATYTMKCLAEAEKRHNQDYPHEPITRPEGAIVTTDYEPATGTGQHQKAVFRFSISTSAFASYLVQMVPTLPAFDRLTTCWHNGDERVAIRVCLDSERTDAISAHFNRATSDSQGLAAESSQQIENHIDLIQDSIHTIATIYSEDRHRAEQRHQESQEALNMLQMNNQSLYAGMAGMQMTSQAQFGVFLANQALSDLRMQLFSYPKDSQEYNDIKEEIDAAKQTVKEAQLIYQQTLQQSNLAIQNANPILHQQRLVNNAPTTPEANITNNSPTRERDESGGSPSKRGHLTHHGRVAEEEGSLVSSVMRTEHHIEEGMSIDP
ncbi:BZ3500_MvSof-1268-A1-R1_Chr5-1g07604 [Microbotryum saponariae]|uniref:BZ3500_MvSof-1268-A1-R1_Chr5-1g07604 protein n=1 Tax=Microbotryum saponariae TaxID=289078 RepID=A0A2X0M8J7_9BASI|nr:BZ3500_MvSof-1268-A1-R1_Chr5-1g07604 [Microbotryum saponariae]SDA05475.1 BZ3501_MvSof-1269-A2-R1_Chr5-2g07428 [Microbotryum saponariae]